ncbi:MAG: hypothetical protein ABI640_08095 [Gammaproteobacteria bacterium]
MNIHRNVLKIVAGALLMASLPAGAQILGGSLGGAANGTLGGALGGGRINGAGSAAGNANAGIDASDTFGAVRNRTQQAGGKSRELGGSAVGTTRSHIESVRGASQASVETASSTSVKTGRRAARAAERARTSTAADGVVATSAQPSNGLALNGSGEASAEQRVMRRTVAADGAAASQTSVNRSGIANSADGEAGLSMKKDGPMTKTPAETTPAK